MKALFGKKPAADRTTVAGPLSASLEQRARQVLGSRDRRPIKGPKLFDRFQVVPDEPRHRESLGLTTLFAELGPEERLGDCYDQEIGDAAEATIAITDDSLRVM